MFRESNKAKQSATNYRMTYTERKQHLCVTREEAAPEFGEVREQFPNAGILRFQTGFHFLLILTAEKSHQHNLSALLRPAAKCWTYQFG